MATLGIVCADNEDLQDLALMAGEAGHNACAARGLGEAVEILRERRPKLMLVCDAPGHDAETLVREILRVSPLIPIVVALKVRDANRAVALMRTGAAEVVAPPWTRENLSACLSKAARFQGTALSLAQAPPRRFRSAPVYFFSVLAFFAAAFGYVAVQRRAESARMAAAQKFSWDLPYKHAGGLAFDGSKLWVLDWFSQSLYVHVPDMKTLPVDRVMHFTADAPVAISFAADFVWTASEAELITRRMKDASLTAAQKYKDQAPRTVGLVFDGLYLWTCDSRKKQIHKRLLDDQLTILASFRYPGGAPAALVFDGKSLWSLDALRHELLRHNLERPDEATERVSLPEYQDGRYKPAGLAWDGKRFWTVGEPLPGRGAAARLFAHKVLEL